MDALHLDRSQLYRYQEMDRSKYNLVIGGMLVYGFFVDALICYFFGDILNYVLDSGPVMIGFFVTNIVCVILSVVLSSSPNAVVNFIGYNLMVLPIGLMLGMVVSAVSYKLVLGALLGTGVFTVLMIAASFIKPEFFLSLGPTLGIALGITVAVELVLFLRGFGTEFTDYIVIAIFSLYLGFDWQRANRVTPSIRNAILSATQIYLDIVNIFIRLLRILARSRKN